MKRISMFVTLFITMLTLVACDLIPEEVFDEVTDVISKELCEEDPDNVLCTLESLDDLEDIIVLGLVEEFHEGYMSDDYSKYCTLLISPSNPELIDACMNKEFEILPADISQFTPEMVENDGSSYVVKGTHDLEDFEFMIYLTIVEVDGRFYIEDYNYDLQRVPMEIMIQGRFDFYDKFFMDLGDRTIDNEAFCNMYYDGIDNDCDGIRDSFLEDVGEVLTVEAIAVVGSSVHGHVTVLKAKEDIDVPLDVLLELVVTEDGEISAGTFNVGDVPTQEEFVNLFDSMLGDYLDPIISDDEFKEMYGGILNSDNELSSRDEYIGMKLVYVTISPLFDGLHPYVVSIFLEGDEGVNDIITVSLNATSFARKGYTYYKNSTLLSVCDGVDDDCDDILDKATALAIYNYYLMKYLDPDTDDDGIIDIVGPQNSEFFEIRQEVQNNKNSIVVVDIVGPIAPNKYIIITDEAEPDGSTRRKHKPVAVTKEVDKATPMLALGNPDDDDDIMQVDELKTILESFTTYYNDESMGSDEVCKMFVSVEDVPACVSDRQKDLDDGVKIESIDVVNGNDLVLRKRPGRTKYSNITLKSGYVINTDGEMKIDFFETALIDYDDFIKEHVEMFLMKLNDLSLEDDMACMYVDMMSTETCQMLRNQVSDTEMVSLNMLELKDSVYLLKLDLVSADGDRLPLDEYEVYVTYDDGMNKLNLTPLL